MAILNVGANLQYTTIASAIAASQDGDVVNVQAGTYTNDFATVYHKITLQGIGGMVKMVATVQPPNGKAILTTDTDVTIDHFEFSGAKVADRNGAGIRYEGGNLTITNSYFHDNENGLLGAPDPNGSITIRTSEFGHNGIGDGQTHNLYAGAVGQLTVTDSYFHDSIIGHEIKSRAINSTITGNRIQDNLGNGSYEIDLPNGGNAVITNNVIQQSAASDNPIVIAFGEEGNLWAGSVLKISGNTIVNDMPQNAIAVYNPAGAPATMTENQVFGFDNPANTRGPVTQSGTTVLATRPVLSTASPIGTVPVPPVVVPPVVVPPDAGLPVIVGSGADSLVLLMSEDRGVGDDKFTVKVDGHLVGGVQTVTALRTAGATQSFTFKGDFGTAAHTVQVQFLRNTTPTASALLTNAGATFNGIVVANSTASLHENWMQQFAIPAVAPPVVVPPVVVPPVVVPPVVVLPVVVPPVTPVTVVGSGADSLRLTVSQDPGVANDRFTVKVDGKTIGMPQVVTALHGAGASQVFDVRGDFGAAQHAVQIQFLRAAIPSDTARLYVESATYDAAVVPRSPVTLHENWMSQFIVPAAPPAVIVAAAPVTQVGMIALLPGH